MEGKRFLSAVGRALTSKWTSLAIITTFLFPPGPVLGPLIWIGEKVGIVEVVDEQEEVAIEMDRKKAEALLQLIGESLKEGRVLPLMEEERKDPRLEKGLKERIGKGTNSGLKGKGSKAILLK